MTALITVAILGVGWFIWLTVDYYRDLRIEKRERDAELEDFDRYYS